MNYQPEHRYLTVPEAAQYMRTTEGTLRQWISKGDRDIPFIKLGRRVLLDIHDIDAWLAEQRVEPT